MARFHRQIDAATGSELASIPFTLQEEADADAIIAAQAATQYQRDRALAYPSVCDQLDMQYHDALNGTSTWSAAIAAVKLAHPKV